MIMRRYLGVALATLGAIASSAGAQVIPEGTSVRASIPTLSPGLLFGRMVLLSGDSVTLRDVHGRVPEGTYFARRISVPRPAVTSLEYLHSRDRANGAFFGAFVGLIPAMIAYYTAPDYEEINEQKMMLVGMISIPTFAIIGSHHGPGRWERVLPRPDRPEAIDSTAVAVPSAGSQAIAEGTRVRMIVPSIGDRLVYGRVVSLSNDSLRLRRVSLYDSSGRYVAPELVLPRQSISRLDMQLRGRRKKGALLGAGLGVLVGMVAEANADAPFPFLGFLLYGGLATTTFAITGALVATPVWQPVAPWP